MLYKLDKQGYVINEASIKKIQKDYFVALEEIKLEVIKRFGNKIRSIYIRGSVSVGRAKKNLSDIDFIVITKKALSKKRPSWIESFLNKMKNKYTFIPFFDFTLTSFDELLTSAKIKNLKIYLKTQSVCLYGEDILHLLPPIKPGRDLAIEMYADLYKELKILQNIFSGKIKNYSYLGKKMPINFWCVWTMRVLIRSGLGLVMFHEPVYSQDLKTCYQLFSRYFPEQKKEMQQALYWAINPTNDKQALFNYLKNFSPQFLKLWEKAQTR